MKNWRRDAALKTLPLIKQNRVRTPLREFWRRFRQQPVALLAGLIVLAFIALYVAPFDAENYFDYDRLNEGDLRCCTGLASIRWDAIFSAGY